MAWSAKLMRRLNEPDPFAVERHDPLGALLQAATGLGLFLLLWLGLGAVTTVAG